MTSIKRDIELRRQQRDAGKENTRDIVKGFITRVGDTPQGDVNGLLWVQGIEGNANVVQVYNPGIIQDPRPGLAVTIERNPKAPARWQLTGVQKGFYFDDQETYQNLPGTDSPPHGLTHYFPPGRPPVDPAWISSHQIVDLAVRPTTPPSMRVEVLSGWYPGVTNWQYLQGPAKTKDFTSDIPGTSGKAVVIAIALTSAGAFAYYNGSDYVDGLPIPATAWPTVPITARLLGAIRLVNGLTAIVEANLDNEMRPLIANNTGDPYPYRLWESDAGAAVIEIDAAGNVTVNDSGADRNVRIETDGLDDALFIDGGTNRVGFGNDAPSAFVHMTAPAVSGQEVPWRLDVSDAPDYLEIRNFVSTDARFLPGFSGYNNSSSAQSAFAIVGQVDATLDTGTSPSMVIDGRRSSGAALTTRPIVDIRNFGSSRLLVDFDGDLTATSSVFGKSWRVSASGVGATPVNLITGLTDGIMMMYWAKDSAGSNAQGSFPIYSGVGHTVGFAGGNFTIDWNSGNIRFYRSSGSNTGSIVMWAVGN